MTGTALVVTEPQKDSGRRDLTKDDEGLTDLQRRFVDAYLANGGKGGAAARSCGEMSTKGSSVYATRTLALPQVQAAIVRRANASLAGLVPKALRSLDKLVTSAKSEYVKLEAVNSVLDRAGVGEQKISTAVAVQVSIDLG